MGRNEQGVRTSGQNNTSGKSATALLKERYLAAMSPLLSVKIGKTTHDGDIMVRFTKYGNEHLYSDTFGRAKGFKKDDLLTLDKALSKSAYADSAALSHPRKDKITKFYYFKDKNKNLYYNVAEEVKKGHYKRYLYSVTNKIKQTRSAY